MNHSTITESKAIESTTTDAVRDLQPPAARHLIHGTGCPLYVWWALGKRRNRDGRHWQCWFVYLEYRQADGQSRYVQQELLLDQAVDPNIWQQLTHVELPGACVTASRANLIGR